MTQIRPNISVIMINIHGLKSPFTIQKPRFRLIYQNTPISSNTLPKKKKLIGYIKFEYKEI